jgi:hypothetical protein
MVKIAILGLGESLNLFNPSLFDLAIGVNDIWRYYESEVVVCLDHRRVFKPERLMTIDSCKPQAFYSQIINWDIRPDFKLIKLAPYYPIRTCNLDSEYINKSLCSPFVACGVAYKFYNADEIHVFGVDLINHPHLDQNMCDRIKLHFRNLKFALAEKGKKIIVHGAGILKNI